MTGNDDAPGLEGAHALDGPDAARWLYADWSGTCDSSFVA